MLRLAELCAGYGGLHLSLVAAGWPVELAWYAEHDPDPDTKDQAAARVMAAHHPGVPNVGDITTAQFSAQQPVDVLACGYPCQPFSAAGRRKGTDDHRWIWPDVARAVRVVRPRWVLLENVPGHLGRGFARVVGDLAALGYVGSWACVRASDVGAPHRRERLFVVAADAERQRLPGWTPGGAGRADPRREGPRPTAAGRGRDAGGVGLLPTPAARAGDSRGWPPEETAARRMQDEGRRNLEDAVALLPTPAARDSGRGSGYGDQPGRPLSETIHRLLPTPTAAHHTRNATVDRHPDDDGHIGWTLNDIAHTGRWGTYAAAIARWEAVLGRPAPDPTEPGSRGQPRLSARFVEWMMGLPAGYVTDHAGRNAALRILGNGVVPAQGAHAITHLDPPGAAVTQMTAAAAPGTDHQTTTAPADATVGA